MKYYKALVLDLGILLTIASPLILWEIARLSAWNPKTHTFDVLLSQEIDAIVSVLALRYGFCLLV